MLSELKCLVDLHRKRRFSGNSVTVNKKVKMLKSFFKYNGGGRDMKEWLETEACQIQAVS